MSASLIWKGAASCAAHDTETGEELWRRFTIARPGEPGGDSWGTGVAGPYPAIARGAKGGDGDLLYSNSTLALNPETGEIAWYYQHLPGDELDMDHVYERILVDISFEPSNELGWYNSAVAGEERKVLWTAGKAGTQFVLDRETGEFLWARPLLHQNAIVDIDETGRVTRNAALVHKVFGDVLVGGPRAGKDWWYGTYSPLTDAVYQPLLNAWLEQTSLDWDGTGNGAIRRTIPSPDQSGFAGMVKGYNVSTGELLWEFTKPRRGSVGWSRLAVACSSAVTSIGDSGRWIKRLGRCCGKPS